MALATSRSHATYIHVMRLLPGDDLLLSIREFVKTQALGAAFIITCVGSVGHCRLRPAGVATPKTWDDRKFEIVSLTGTMECNDDSSEASEHLHMSVSDHDCNVFGGHVVEGCIVRTTAEIVIGVGEGMALSRALDDRSGYEELYIVET
mmetsp:Transcript_32409/g.52220  ORF Transcript_32409/g.52220 Transcript_32409/m.52220 type:complete len:149 (+) Transcript_32409:13-459(+)